MTFLLILVLCVVGLVGVALFVTLGLAAWIVKLVLKLLFLPVILVTALARPRRVRPVWRL
jgi:ABC-type phosphate transport system permease subunit